MKFSILTITAKTPVIMEPAEMLVLAQELYAKINKTVASDTSVAELVRLLGNMLTIVEAVDEDAAAVIEAMDTESARKVLAAIEK